MRRPLTAGAEGDEPPIDLDDRRIVDQRIAGELRLRLGGAGRPGEGEQSGESYESPCRPCPLAPPHAEAHPARFTIAHAGNCGRV